MAYFEPLDWDIHDLETKKLENRDFPGSLVAKTLHSQCRGPGAHPWLGT